MRVDIDGAQASQLDAIAFCANAIDLLYRRLANALLAADRDVQAEEVLPDAWGMIDWVHRLDGLVERCRGLSGKSEAVIEYRNASPLVENHRHAIQHLEGIIPVLVASGRSPWGHLCWTVRIPPGPDGNKRFEMRAVGGSLRGAVEPTFRLPAIQTPRGPIDYVSLYAADGETEIGLTGQHDALTRFVRKLEASAATAQPNAKGILILRP